MCSDRQRFHRRCAAAFSFIEVMIVIVIIGLLAGAVAWSSKGWTDKARRNRAKSDVATIVNAVEAFYADKGRYPTAEEGIGALSLKNTNDPWGRPYQYTMTGDAFVVFSYGADGQEGGTGAAEDITSESLATQE